MLLVTHYAQNYAGIIDGTLLVRWSYLQQSKNNTMIQIATHLIITILYKIQTVMACVDIITC